MCRVRHGLFVILLLTFTLSSYARIETAIAGRLEILVKDADGGAAQYEYSLRTADGSSVRLEFQHRLPLEARAGVTMRARGNMREDGTLVVSGMRRVRDRAIVSNALVQRAESVLVLIGYYPSTQAPCSRNTAQSVFFANAPALSVKNYYLTSAHGGLTSFTGTVLDPIELTPFTAANGCVPDQWADYLDNQARLRGTDPANYTRTQYVVPNSCTGFGGYATLGSKRSWVTVCNLNVMGHELGHSLGMDHANANGVEYADPYDIMHSSIYADPQPELNAPHRLQLNFLPAERAVTVFQSGTYDIGALELDGSWVAQVLRLPRSTLPDDYIYVSYRARGGTFDAALEPPQATHVYRWDGGKTDLRATLQDNGVYDESGITVRQVMHSPTQSTVQVTFVNPPPPPCIASATTLCLRDNRFRVTATFRQNGATSNASAIPFSNDTGYFWFFSSNNTELAVKVLDGRPVNGKFWVYFGGMTSLEYTIAITDMATGLTETYLSTAGNLCGGADVNFGIPGRAPAGVQPAVTAGPGPAVTCTADADTLCLQPGGDVIKVETSFSGGLAGVGLLPQTQQAGYFTFFNPANVELITKVLDGRAVNSRYWIFTGALSDVAYTATYTNTRSGRWVKVSNPQGNYCGSAITNLLY